MRGRRGILVAFLVISLCDTASAKDLAAVTQAEWRDDLQYLVTTLRQRHPNAFHAASEARFDTAAAELRAQMATLEPYQIIVRMAALTALIGDGHTGIPLLSRTFDFRYFPLRFQFYDEGLFVEGAYADSDALVGGRLLSIDGVPVDEIARRVETVVMRDNPSSARARIAETLSIGEALHALGITASPDEAVFSIIDRGGNLRSVLLRAARGDLPRKFAGGSLWEGTRRISRLGQKPSTWLSHPDKPYWFQLLDGGILYVQINQMANDGNEPLAAFFDRAIREGEAAGVRRLILDLRLNDGGDHIHLPLVHAIIRHPLFDKRGGLFVLIGPATFSAAETFASALEIHTNAIFIGEPTGGRPNHYGSGGALFLPNSNVRVRHARVYFQNSDPSDNRAWIPPEVYAPRSVVAELAGRDDALAAAVGWQETEPLAETLNKAYAKGGIASSLDALSAFRTDRRNAYRAVRGPILEFGNRLAKEGHPADALILLKWAVAAEPQSSTVHESLGTLLGQLGKTVEAIQEFERVLALDPADRNAAVQLERLRAQYSSRSSGGS
jgi:tetratricopeptide (TPR) repeat protein